MSTNLVEAGKTVNASVLTEPGLPCLVFSLHSSGSKKPEKAQGQQWGS